MRREKALEKGRRRTSYPSDKQALGGGIKWPPQGHFDIFCLIVGRNQFVEIIRKINSKLNKNSLGYFKDVSKRASLRRLSQWDVGNNETRKGQFHVNRAIPR